MSFLNVNLNDVKDLVALPDGEYELRLYKAELKTVEKVDSVAFGAEMINMAFDVPSETDAKDISHTLWLPKASDSEKDQQNALRRLKYFCDAFGIDYSSGINLDEIIGATGWALLKTESSDEYGDQNRIRRFITPK